MTSSPNQLVLIDSTLLIEIKRVSTGAAPDGVAWDPTHKMVGVSDQGDGALSIIRDSGSGARTHGLRLHPDGQSAFIACEANDALARVDLGGAHAVVTGKAGSGADVLALDPGLGWLYVAAESGDLTVFDVRQPGVVLVGHDQPGNNAHSVAVDPATHRVFFPLMVGPKGTPVLRIMQPKG